MSDVLRPNQKEQMEKLAELIDDIEVAMLTTLDENGRFHSRPMMTQTMDSNGDLWFISSNHSQKIFEIEKKHQVLLAYSCPVKERYVSVYGECEVYNDRDKINELWNATYSEWFPQGPQDPKIVLLKVEVGFAEYWDSKKNIMTRLFESARAALTGDREARSAGGHDRFEIAI